MLSLQLLVCSTFNGVMLRWQPPLLESDKNQKFRNFFEAFPKTASFLLLKITFICSGRENMNIVAKKKKMKKKNLNKRLMWTSLEYQVKWVKSNLKTLNF